jgi:hypothetical protein
MSPEERKRERKRKNAIYSGHLRKFCKGGFSSVPGTTTFVRSGYWERGLTDNFVRKF